MESMPGESMVLRAGPDDANTSIPAPTAGDVRAAQAVFQVNYSGFPTQAQMAFQAAVDIWASLVWSPVPIVIDASWEPLDPRLLSDASSTLMVRDFPGAPRPGTWYVSALANALSWADLSPSVSDIDANFNSAGVAWYFGTDGHPPPGQYDLETVVLHEIAHGLGFGKSMAVNLAGIGSWGHGTTSPFLYDRFTQNGSGTGLLLFPNKSSSLGSQLESNNVFFSGAFANAANGGSPIKLYAPSPWENGSSISHFDETTNPPGNPNSLMTPILATAESIHSPGRIVLGVLQDLGWNVAAPPPAPVVPVERIYGQDAIGTSLATSQALFVSSRSASAVVLARSDHFADALAGGPLAALQKAPLLITAGAPSSATLDPRVLAEIQRVLPAGKTVYILGGPLAIAPGIDATLQALRYTVVRVQGANQYATAVAIAGQLGNPNTVFEATGLDFADSLSAVPAAIQDHGAILLTSGNVQAPETAEYLEAHPPAVRYAIGGPLAAAGADPGAIAVWGQDLFATSAAVAQRFFLNATTLGAATGFDFPDALSGGVFMGSPSHLGPMLLVTPHRPIPPSINDYITQPTQITHGYVFGGPVAVGDDIAGSL